MVVESLSIQKRKEKKLKEEEDEEERRREREKISFLINFEIFISKNLNIFLKFENGLRVRFSLQLYIEGGF